MLNKQLKCKTINDNREVQKETNNINVEQTKMLKQTVYEL